MIDKELLPDFSEKYISMRVAGSNYLHDLENPKFEYQGGKLFIIGKIPKSLGKPGWDDGKVAAIDWQHVRKYTLFDSLEELHEAWAIAERDENT
ncbi:MAG: hypothetical protein ABW155_15365 [Candidatus Thiodiazotropha sp.]